MVGETCGEGQYVSQEMAIAPPVFGGKVDGMPAAAGIHTVGTSARKRRGLLLPQ